MYYLIDIDHDEVLGVGKTKELAIANFQKEYEVSEYNAIKIVLAQLIKPMKVAIAVVEAE